MTAVDIAFQCRVTPTERQMIALDLLREVYGVRKTSFEERSGSSTTFPALLRQTSLPSCMEQALMPRCLLKN